VNHVSISRQLAKQLFPPGSKRYPRIVLLSAVGGQQKLACVVSIDKHECGRIMDRVIQVSETAMTFIAVGHLDNAVICNPSSVKNVKSVLVMTDAELSPETTAAISDTLRALHVLTEGFCVRLPSGHFVQILQLRESKPRRISYGRFGSATKIVYEVV
jgi:hypothetical protein